MMASLTFSVFLKLYDAALTIAVLCSSVQMAKVIEANKDFSRGRSSLGVRYAKFKKDRFYYLDITSLGSDLVETESQCGLACLETPSCFSYNMAAFLDINGQRFCELLPSDKFNISEKLVPSNSHHHYFIASQCNSWPCKNKGMCVSLYEENSFICVCKEGFTGKNCETDVNECESNPCLNNGTCIDNINGFNCSCPPGFVGNRCEIDVNECESNPCLNDGTCVDKTNGFICSCPSGFVGDRCETATCRKRTTSGVCCSFPFIYGGVLYNSCTVIHNNNIPWCSTTPNFDVDGQYGNCA